MFNCLVEAAVQEAYKNCGCYPGYLFSSNNTCYGHSFRCFKQVFYYLGIKRISVFQPLQVEKKQYPLIFIGKYHEVEDRGMKKTCMAACRDQTFSASVYTTKFPSEENYNHRQGFCLIVRWI